MAQQEYVLGRPSRRAGLENYQQILLEIRCYVVAVSSRVSHAGLLSLQVKRRLPWGHEKQDVPRDTP